MKAREAIRLLELYGLDELRPVLRKLVSEGMMYQDGVQYVGPEVDAPGRGVVARTQHMRTKGKGREKWQQCI